MSLLPFALPNSASERQHPSGIRCSIHGLRSQCVSRYRVPYRPKHAMHTSTMQEGVLLAKRTCRDWLCARASWSTRDLAVCAQSFANADLDTGRCSTTTCLQRPARANSKVDASALAKSARTCVPGTCCSYNARNMISKHRHADKNSRRISSGDARIRVTGQYPDCDTAVNTHL